MLMISAANCQHSARAFADLDDAVKNKQQYVDQKETLINSIKNIQSSVNSNIEQYQLNKSLFVEYRKFKLDSAIAYVLQNSRIAGLLVNDSLNTEVSIQLANLYSSSGMYRESEEILKEIRSSDLPKTLLPAYYETYSQFYEHYATNSFSEEYVKKVELYRDSLLLVSDPSSVKYAINLAQKNIYGGNVDAALQSLLTLMSNAREKDPDYAMFTYLIADIYGLKKQVELQKQYYAMSAAADIRNAIKDNAAIQSLALLYFQTGDIDDAYRFTQSALEDAIFCKVKFRTLHMSELYSIINTAYLEKEAARKSQLKLYLLLISLLSLFLIVAVLYVYKQMKKVAGIQQQLATTNQQLVALNEDITGTNEQLSQMNVQLSESNHIKEEYIANFFDLCSAYINKLEDYRQTLYKKAAGKQTEELFRILKSTTVVENELEELYRNFDHIFLNLYPTFIRDFNSLRAPEEQIVLKQGELLNTELRIFALIRLGITDSIKIAAFLRYSISTIYNYRTKARNKAIVAREEFESHLMKIGKITSANPK